MGARRRTGGARAAKERAGKTALVCAGGGITGALYEVGALLALDRLLDRSVVDLDLYVGVSGGAFVAALLAAGIPPVEIYEDATTSARLRLPRPPLLLRPGLGELLKRSLHAPIVLSRALGAALSSETRHLADLGLPLFQLLPPGLLDNSGVRELVAKLLRSRGQPDRFEELARELYVVAVDLDSGEAVTFGEAGQPRVPVSRAVQASTALPGLCRPVRIGGRDFVDGAVRKTAHVSLAIRRGARLVICINPIVPILNAPLRGPLGGRRLSELGVTYVLDQVLRVVLHGRVQYGLERYRAEHPEVDILVVEPPRDDMSMFRHNIMRYSARRIAAEDGYRSVVHAFRTHASAYGRLLGRHGIGLRDPYAVPETPPPPTPRSSLARRLGSTLDRLRSSLEAEPGNGLRSKA